MQRKIFPFAITPFLNGLCVNEIKQELTDGFFLNQWLRITTFIYPRSCLYVIDICPFWKVRMIPVTWSGRYWWDTLTLFSTVYLEDTGWTHSPFKCFIWSAASLLAKLANLSYSINASNLEAWVQVYEMNKSFKRSRALSMLDLYVNGLWRDFNKSCVVKFWRCTEIRDSGISFL